VFRDRGELGRAGVVAKDNVGRLGGRLEGDAAVVVMERVSDGGRRDLPAVALCEVDGLVVGKGCELAGEDKEEAEETVGRLWLGNGLGAGCARTGGFGGLCSGPVELVWVKGRDWTLRKFRCARVHVIQLYQHVGLPKFPTAPATRPLSTINHT
jgi:hypothetical protein